MALAFQERTHRTASMRGKSVPDERGLVTTQQFAQLAEELHQCLVVERARAHGEHEVGVGPVGGEGEGARHQEALPVEVVGEHRGRSARRPSGPHRGEQREARLVFEDDPRPSPSGDFLTTGQQSRAQAAMATWSASRARRAGR